MKKYTLYTITFTILLCININAVAKFSYPASIKYLAAQRYIYKKGLKPTTCLIVVNTATQTLYLYKNAILKKTYKVSTSKFGSGQQINSNKTPIGLHQVSEKIGNDVPKHGILRQRIYTGKKLEQYSDVYTDDLWKPDNSKDFITSRILRLEGLEAGINKGQNKAGKIVDTKKRLIYIHGTNKEQVLGSPSSIGCIYMSSADVIHLFKQIPIGTLVLITNTI